MDLGKFSQRALTERDAADYIALARAIGEADEDPDYRDEAAYRELLHSPLATPELDDFTGLFDGGRLVAYGRLTCRTSADPVHWMITQGGVHPDYRGLGLGTELIRWQQELAPKVHERRFPGRPLEISLGAVEGNATAHELFRNEGFTPQRWYFGMRRPESAPIGPDLAPQGLEFAPYADLPREELRLVHNEAFADHFHFTPQSAETWAAWTGQDKIRKDLSFLLRDERTAEPAGYLVASFSEAEFAATAVRDIHFNLIGTRRAHRRRGVASALIAHAVHASRRLGFQTASLHVDAQNPTGALGVYEKSGFECIHKFHSYNKVLLG
jgi:GNAT superfamily N-acetyltransferase